VSKKTYLAVVVIVSILLYAALVLDQMAVIGLGELFGYLFYAIIIAGIVAAIWLLIKRPQKGNS
jgi:hypothetical protein